MLTFNSCFIVRASEQLADQNDLVEIVVSSILQDQDLSEEVICELDLLSDDKLKVVFAKIVKSFVEQYKKIDPVLIVNQLQVTDKIALHLEMFQKYLNFLDRRCVDEYHAVAISYLDNLRKILNCLSMNEECPICCYPIDRKFQIENNIDYLVTDCQHVFCTNRDCILDWELRNGSCPVCRNMVVRVKSENQIISCFEKISNNQYFKD